MKKVFIVLMTLFLLSACGQHKTIYDSPNNVYQMELTLDADNDSLIVEGELYYKNDDVDLDELYVIVYPNAYNLSESGDNVDFEYFRINEIEASYELTGSDRTALHVQLDETLIQGERISITFKYQFHYWDIDRILVENNYYLTLFFFPWVVMKDDSGWHIDPYSFRGETYYNNLSDYYVSINVPSDYLVASSGKLIDDYMETGRKILKYELIDARDFSFSASSEYHFYHRKLNGIDYEIYSVRELTGTEIENSFSYLDTTMQMMENEIGDYYYDHFTLEYGHYYGMESSGVIYCSSDIQESTIVHELIHQWFYSMIGNDQANESFLDEALTTYATAFYYYDLYGLNGYNGYLNYRTSLKPELSEKYNANIGVNLLRQVDEYGEYYGFLIYYHGPAMFRYYVDEFLDGDIEKMKEILSIYYNEYAQEIATLDEFLDLLERESSEPITKEWFYLQLNELQDFDNRP